MTLKEFKSAMSGTLILHVYNQKTYEACYTSKYENCKQDSCEVTWFTYEGGVFGSGVLLVHVKESG